MDVCRMIPTGHHLSFEHTLVTVLLVSIGSKSVYVTTCLVVLNSRFYFWKNRLRRRTPTMDHHGHDGPSQGLVAKHLENLKLGTENWLSELRNEMAGRTVTCVTDRHRLWWKLSLWILRRPAGRTVSGTTGRRRLRNPSLGRISLYVLRDVFDYSCFNYKVSGLMLISLITWGLKEVTLS